MNIGYIGRVWHASMPRIWLGGIYLNDEGGYEIVLRALDHYRRRLKTLQDSPELEGAAAMFASVLGQQAARTVPRIDRVMQKILDSLGDTRTVCELAGEAPFLQKALESYRADITKAQDTGHGYFLGLIGDMPSAADDLEAIGVALARIGSFADHSP